MTTEEHRQRHIELHQALDELLADYIRHHPLNLRDGHDMRSFLSRPIGELLEWSASQTSAPTPED
jgi:hypothetical protein